MGVTPPTLGAIAAEAGHTLSYFDTIGSTNAHALDLASKGAASGAWVVAGQQTQGRGRLGRNWVSPPGNFYGSLLLIDPCSLQHAAKLGFVAGVALVQTIQTLAPQITGLRLKWPNDLLLSGAKIAGILLEATTLRDGRLAIVIGMGVNLAFHPDDTPYPATNLANAGFPISRQAMLTVLSDAFVDCLARFDRGAGFARLREQWLAAAYGLGGTITVRLPQTTIDGTFESIDADGRLILMHDDKPQLIDAGDVYFPALSALGA